MSAAERGSINGAESLVASLVASGVDTCFANPGTSEIHVVAAIDSVAGMRPILCLFEGAVTGAADGYGRMAGGPAAALLHLGPGLANGTANLHNARRGATPLVAVVGDHATYHKRLDAPLESDIDSLAWTAARWVRRSWRPADVGADAAAAVVAARQGGVATLVVPADVSWGDGGRVADRLPVPPPRPVGEQAVAAAAAALSWGEPTVLLVGGPVVTCADALGRAAAVAATSGATLVCETFPARAARGAGRPPMGRLPYLVDLAAAQLEGARHLILAGAQRPVAFFAYPGAPGDLVPAGCTVHDLGRSAGAVGAVAELAERVGAGSAPAAPAARPDLPTGPLDASGVAAAVGALLPDDAIVVDEAITSGFGLGGALAGAPPFDLLALPGGAIGFGLPAATGAAVACPDRPVLCLEGDGSAVYTISALWTQAREGLDVTTVVYDNAGYAILRMELERAAGPAGPAARRLLDMSGPAVDFVHLAGGFGVPASRAATGEELADQLRRAFAEPGPHLISATVGA